MVESLSKVAAMHRQQLRDWNNPKREVLRDIFTDPITIFARNVERFVTTHPELVNEIAHWNPVYQLPYRRKNTQRDLHAIRSPKTRQAFAWQHDRNWAQNNVQFNERRGFFQEAKGKYDNLLVTSSSSPYPQANPLRAPIGEYGRDFAERLLRTLSFLVEFAGQDKETQEAFFGKVALHRHVARDHILRAIDRRPPLHPGEEEGAVASLQEGLVSMFSVLFMHTTEKKEGYKNDPDGLVALLCESDLINATTGISPLAVAFPTSAYGRRFEKPNDIAGDKLVNSRELIEHLEIMRRLSDSIEYDAWVQYLERVNSGDSEATPPVRLALVCPAYGKIDALTPGAISQITRIIPMVLRCITLDHEADEVLRAPEEFPIFLDPAAHKRGETFVMSIDRMRDEGILPPRIERTREMPPDILIR